MRRRGVLLDRDGTLNVRPRAHHYVTSVSDFRWLPGAREALARLARAGYVLAVASNQRGVARGLVGEAVLSDIESRIQAELRPLGCAIAAFRYCPHELDAGCDCRKPRPGMLIALASALDLDLQRSWMVGDSEADVAAGRAACCRTAFIGAESAGDGADVIGASLPEVAARILEADGT